MRVIVLGAGVVGTTAAWYLARAGHEVTVIERQGAAGLETSLANGGQISAANAAPWANPEAPARIIEWLGREDAPLLFRFRADWQQWAWGLRFLLECLPSCARENKRQLVALATYSRTKLGELRRETAIQYDQLQCGILHFYTDEAEFEHAASQNCGEMQVKTAEECIALEPALRHAAEKIIGGTYFPGDESGDAHRFTQELARLAAEHGVRFLYGRSLKRLDAEGGRIASAVLADAHGGDDCLSADAYVMALGSYSAPALRPLGVRIPVYPLKGYSITIPLEEGDEAPTISLTDESYKLVFSRLGTRFRVAGTAELNGYDTSLSDDRCQAIVRRTFDLFPTAGHPERAEFWTGLRPATPSNVPLIGRTKRYANLFLNTGHGTLGWTMACGSGRALADIVSGREPEPDFPFLGMPRRARSVLVEKPSAS
jgi:D-amino-acid dehydrogenase